MPARSFVASLAVQAGSQPASPSRLPASESSSFDLQPILSGLLVIGLEVGLVVLVCGVLYVLTTLILSRIGRTRAVSLAPVVRQKSNRRQVTVSGLDSS
jgi:hypothetical protein